MIWKRWQRADIVLIVAVVSSTALPDVMVFDDTEEQKRYTGTPHLAVEVLSSDPARDIIRKAAKYAAAGLPHYWIIDPAGPEVIVRHGPGMTVGFNVGPVDVAFDPADLLK